MVSLTTRAHSMAEVCQVLALPGATSRKADEKINALKEMRSKILG